MGAALEASDLRSELERRISSERGGDFVQEAVSSSLLPGIQTKASEGGRFRMQTLAKGAITAGKGFEWAGMEYGVFWNELPGICNTFFLSSCISSGGGWFFVVVVVCLIRFWFGFFWVVFFVLVFLIAFCLQHSVYPLNYLGSEKSSEQPVEHPTAL